MNKFSVVSLVAGVGLVTSASVHAQSSVTMYGILDVGVEYANHVMQGVTYDQIFRTTS